MGNIRTLTGPYKGWIPTTREEFSVRVGSIGVPKEGIESTEEGFLQKGLVG